LHNVFQRGPEDEIIDRDFTNDFWNKFLNCLSSLEAEILVFYLKGLSYQKIASEVKPVKSIDNAIQRVRKKLAQFISSGDISKS